MQRKLNKSEQLSVRLGSKPESKLLRHNDYWRRETGAVLIKLQRYPK